jgi:hypothetical protein
MEMTWKDYYYAIRKAEADYNKTQREKDSQFMYDIIMSRHSNLHATLETLRDLEIPLAIDALSVKAMREIDNELNARGKSDAVHFEYDFNYGGEAFKAILDITIKADGFPVVIINPIQVVEK